MADRHWTLLGQVNEDAMKRAERIRPSAQFFGDPIALRRRYNPQGEPIPTGDVADVVEKEIQVITRDGHSLQGKLFHSPKHEYDGKPPLVLMTHPGGFVLGNHWTETVNARIVAKKYGCACLAVDYRTAPEHSFPTPFNDVFDVLKYAATNAETLNVDLEKGFVVGGTSAGANLIMAAALEARDTKLEPSPTGIFLLSPWLLSPEVVPEKFESLYKSRTQQKDAAMLSQDAIEYFIDKYKPDVKSHHYNVFNNPNGHARLPAIYFQICGVDPLRDEALIYAKVLKEEHKTRVKVDTYPGLPHVFWLNWPELEESAQEQEDFLNGVAWLLKSKR